MRVDWYYDYYRLEKWAKIRAEAGPSGWPAYLIQCIHKNLAIFHSTVVSFLLYPKEYPQKRRRYSTLVAWISSRHFWNFGTCDNAAAVSETVKQFGEQIGLALLDSLLQKSQEEVARQALQRQIELLDDINPTYAKLLRQIPPDALISAALAQRQVYAPDTGNPFLNVLAKNGIVVNDGQTNQGQLNTTQQFGNVFQAVLRNILQSVQPSIVQNSLLGPQLPTQEVTNPLAPNANQLLIPQPSHNGLPFSASQAQAILGPLVSASSKPAQVPEPPGFKTEAPDEAPPNPFAPSNNANSFTLPDSYFTTPKAAVSPTAGPRGSRTTVRAAAEKGDSSADEEREKDAGEAAAGATAAAVVTTTEGSDEDNNDRVTTRKFWTKRRRTTTQGPSLPIRSDRRRLDEINSRANRLLAYRKLRQYQSTPAQPQIEQWSKETGDNDQEIKATKPPESGLFLKDVDEAPSSSNAAGASPDLVLGGDKSRLIIRNNPTSTVLEGSTKFGAKEANGGALRLPLRGGPAGGLGRKKEREMGFNGKVNLPKSWLTGQELSLDGTVVQSSNNGIFSGMEFLRHR